MGLLLDLLTVQKRKKKTITVSRDAGIQIEFLGVATVIRDAQLPEELIGAVTARDARLPAEIIGALSRDAQLPEELLGAAARDAQIPEEFIGAIARNARLPEELLGASARDAHLPEEFIGALRRNAQLPAEFLAVVQLARDARVPVEFLTTPAFFLGFLGGGGGAPVWWREIPTPAYTRLSPKTPAEHLHDRKAAATKRWIAKRKRSWDHQVVASEAIFTARALIRLRRRKETRAKVHPRPLPPLVEAQIDLRESDEEFLVLTGQL